MDLPGVTPPPAFGRPGAFPAPQPEEHQRAPPLCRIPNPLVKKFAWVDPAGDHSARLTVSVLIVYAKRDRGQYAKRPAKKTDPSGLFPKSAK
jgi:hypothetical protein